MSEKPAERAGRSLAPIGGALLALFVLVAPLVAINLHVEPQTGDQPVRIAKWLDSFEDFAMFLMLCTVGIVVVLGIRKKQRALTIAGMSAVQGVVVVFLAFPMMLFSRGGGFFGATHIESSYNANGTRGAHVYSTGFMECEHSIYESEGWAIRMKRVQVLRGCSKPVISWDDQGMLQVQSR